MVDASTALAIGLVDEVCPDAELAERAQHYAAGLARGASVAVELTRRIVRRSLERNLEESIAYEAWAQSVVVTTQDRIEGGRAFFERRPPRFEGR
jgi:enoyl-CoA hydratase/carnithine racemase